LITINPLKKIQDCSVKCNKWSWVNYNRLHQLRNNFYNIFKEKLYYEMIYKAKNIIRKVYVPVSSQLHNIPMGFAEIKFLPTHFKNFERVFGVAYEIFSVCLSIASRLVKLLNWHRAVDLFRWTYPFFRFPNKTKKKAHPTFA